MTPRDLNADFTAARTSWLILCFGWVCPLPDGVAATRQGNQDATPDIGLDADAHFTGCLGLPREATGPTAVWVGYPRSCSRTG